jgi:hypothetical protein
MPPDPFDNPRSMPTGMTKEMIGETSGGPKEWTADYIKKMEDHSEHMAPCMREIINAFHARVNYEFDRHREKAQRADKFREEFHNVMNAGQAPIPTTKY